MALKPPSGARLGRTLQEPCGLMPALPWAMRNHSYSESFSEFASRGWRLDLLCRLTLQGTYLLLMDYHPWSALQGLNYENDFVFLTNLAL